MTLEELKAASLRKIQHVEAEYWRLRNGKTEHMFCPYCESDNTPGKEFCCLLFAKAFRAILDRQEEVDKGMAQAAMLARLMDGEPIN